MESANEIVVYRPDETMKIDVLLARETVWLDQVQMAELFGCSSDNVGLHLKNIYRTGELTREATAEKISAVRQEGTRKVTRTVSVYNLDAIISVGYRVNSIRGVQFRQWATGVLREYLLRGFSLNANFNRLEERMDRRLAKHDADIADLRGKVDFFVRTSLPPVQGVFYDGQVFDARLFATRRIASARRKIVLIDSWVDVTTLDVLSKKGSGVDVLVVTSPRGNRLKQTDISAFNAQYGGLTVWTSQAFHDRFLILDARRLYLIGASLKDLGRKCFAFTQLDATEIAGLESRIMATGKEALR